MQEGQPSRYPGLIGQFLVATALTIFGLTLPLLGVYLLLVLPTPVALATLHSDKRGMALIGWSALMAYGLGAVPGTLVVILCLGGIGLALGLGAREGLPGLALWSRGTLVGLVSFGLLHFVLARIIGSSPVGEIMVVFEEVLTAVDGEAEALAMVAMVRQILPSVFLVTMGFIAALNQTLFATHMARTGRKASPFPSPLGLRIPRVITLLYLVVYLAEASWVNLDLGGLAWLTTNLGLILGVVFLIQGVSLLWVGMERMRVAVVVRYILGYLLIAMVLQFQGVGQLVIVLGLIESWINLRKL